MRRWLVIAAIAIGPLGCDSAMANQGDKEATVTPRPTWARASLRAYDGAPPVIPHRVRDGGRCEACHDERGMEIVGFGVAPPSPHGKTPGLAAARCKQCHVPIEAQDQFAANDFPTRWWTGTKSGSRLYADAPPVAPHRYFMHENCLSCHSGPAARPELRTSHPDRARCVQCHAFANAADTFARAP